jgi:hypothetical protein
MDGRGAQRLELRIRSGRLARRARLALEESVATDRKQPRATTRPRLKLISMGPRLEVRLLYQVFRARGVARQMNGEAVDGVQLREQILLECRPVGPDRFAHG